jgi:hypothetical protein
MRICLSWERTGKLMAVGGGKMQTIRNFLVGVMGVLSLAVQGLGLSGVLRAAIGDIPL